MFLVFIELFIFGGIVGLIIFFPILGIWAITGAYKLNKKQEAEKEITDND